MSARERDSATRREWIEGAKQNGARPLSRPQLDAIWREYMTGALTPEVDPRGVGDFGDAPIEELLLTIEEGISAES